MTKMVTKNRYPLPELIPSRLTGAESVIDDGHPVPGLTVLDFWRWAASDLADNVVRGWFAEFLVAAALGTHHGVRQSWDTVDVKTKAGKTIQVKCSAYLQSWAQERLSPVRFSVKAARAWDPDTGTMKDRAGTPTSTSSCTRSTPTRQRLIPLTSPSSTSMSSPRRSSRRAGRGGARYRWPPCARSPVQSDMPNSGVR